MLIASLQPITAFPSTAECARVALRYAMALGERCEAAENMIAKDALCSVRYAVDVLKGRFEAGEKMIASDAGGAALLYAQLVLKRPFTEAEPLLAVLPDSAYFYARDVLKGPFPAGEPAIANSLCAIEYARDVLKGRFEAGEATIATSGFYSYIYARDVLKGRFELGEAAIAQTSCADIANYAMKITGERFKLGEPELKGSPLWKPYCAHFGSTQWSLFKEWVAKFF